MIKRNHTWENIIDGYPLTLVQNLFWAGRENDRIEHIENITGTAMAVTHAIDLTFNKGKGKVLEGYVKAILKEGKKEKESKSMESKPSQGVKMSKSAMEFFNSLPSKETIENGDTSG